MLSRRELIAAGVAGSLAPVPAEAAETESRAQEADREGQREIAVYVANLVGVFL